MTLLGRACLLWTAVGAAGVSTARHNRACVRRRQQHARRHVRLQHGRRARVHDRRAVPRPARGGAAAGAALRIQRVCARRAARGHRLAPARGARGRVAAGAGRRRVCRALTGVRSPVSVGTEAGGLSALRQAVPNRPAGAVCSRCSTCRRRGLSCCAGHRRGGAAGGAGQPAHGRSGPRAAGAADRQAGARRPHGSHGTPHRTRAGPLSAARPADQPAALQEPPSALAAAREAAGTVVTAHAAATVVTAHAAAAAAADATARRAAGGDAGEAAAQARQAGSLLEQLARQLGLRPEHLRDLRLGPRLWAPSLGGRQQAPCGAGGSGSGGGGSGVSDVRPPAGGGTSGAGSVSAKGASQRDPQPHGTGEQAAASSRRCAFLDHSRMLQPGLLARPGVASRHNAQRLSCPLLQPCTACRLWRPAGTAACSSIRAPAAQTRAGGACRPEARCGGPGGSVRLPRGSPRGWRARSNALTLFWRPTRTSPASQGVHDTQNADMHGKTSTCSALLFVLNTCNRSHGCETT